VKNFFVHAPGAKFADKAGAFPGGALQNSTLKVNKIWNRMQMIDTNKLTKLIMTVKVFDTSPWIFLKF
jgi:hypothetical protein